MQKIIQVSDDFWNIRGSFRIGGVVDIGTHASLIKKSDGKFIFLDSYTFSGKVARELKSITGDGKNVDAILNLHPFHTIHVQAMHQQYPQAKLYGTARHQLRFPDLPWEKLRTEQKGLHTVFKKDFDFSVPEGVDFISSNESVHFSSVLAYHRASATAHVNDTVMVMRLPRLMRMVGVTDPVSFHPTLSNALEPRKGAAQEFRKWSDALTKQWGSAENLCAAHMGNLLAKENRGASIQKRLQNALKRVEPKLLAHERKFD